MKIRVLAVGTRMPSWVQQGCDDYQQRIKASCHLDLVEIPLAKRTKTSDSKRVMDQEAAAIEKQLRPREKLIALDVIGRSLSTEKLASKLSHWQMEAEDIAFVIGGPDGLDPRIKKRASELWSLSELTMPHPFARLLLIEQLYRGLMINSNHPYHRE